MNESHSSDQKQLEQATSRWLPPGGPLDNETAELRHGWLALGRDLDRKNASFREEDLLARLLTSVRGEQQPVSPARTAHTGRLWPALLASALALLLLVEVTRTLRVGDPNETAANSKHSEQSGAGPAILAADWEDRLDDDLHEAAERVRSLMAQGTGVDASLSNLSDHLESMSDDLSTSSL